MSELHAPVSGYLGNQHDCEYATDPRQNKDLAATLRGKSVLIAGAGRGIGRATAEFFSHTEAASLGLMALELDEVDETAKLCKAINPKITTKTSAFDVRDYAAVQRFVDECDQAFGGIDVLFMNAGRPPQFLPIHECNPKVWWDTLAISLQGAFNYSRAVIPLLRQRQKGGSIIFTSSAGAHANQIISSYGLGKLGMVRLAEMIHIENKEHGIKAFAIHPGSIATRFFTDFRDAVKGKITEGSYISSTIPGEDKSVKTAFGFLAGSTWDTPQMPAGLVVALASGRFDFLSGRYVDASRSVGAYAAESERIKKQDLHRVRLVVDTDWFIPTSKE